MFGIITDLIEDAVDITASVLTLGEYGELSKENVGRLIEGGMNLYTISELTGVGIDVLQNVLEND